MSFSRKYILWLLGFPAVVTGPLSFIFLTQVVTMSSKVALEVFALFAVFFVIGAIGMSAVLTPLAERVADAVRRGEDASEPASACLERTQRLAAMMWSAGCVLYAITGTLLVMRTAAGFGYFLISGLIAAFPSVVWAYAGGKYLLIQHTQFTSRSMSLRYSGREFPVGRKIAIIFVGSVFISFAALVALTASKVSAALEQLAINSVSDRFQRMADTANLVSKVEPSILNDLSVYVPPGHSSHLITPDGVVHSNGEDKMTEDEVTRIRQIGTGDSSEFVSPNVVRFTRLRDGSILVLQVPWDPYRDIPRRITMYVTIVALFTMLAFIGAAYFLSRDVARPVHRLRAFAAEMAQGNFTVEPRVFSDDEVGELANSFAETRKNLRRLVGRIGGSGGTITEGVRVITGGTESLLLHARDQTSLTENSSLAVENVRGGISSVLAAAEGVADLTQDASSRALELQASAEEVARSMDYLFQSVEKTSSSTTEMHATMSETSRRADVLADVSEEVLSFVSEMDATIVELRGTASSTADISRQVREDAQAGGQAVAKTVEGINLSRDVTNSTAATLEQLQRSVGQISQILDVIEEITNRTNLLALNAAIIAAQAGEQGLGFTVVADEIRQLAERTRGSTKEISTIIKAVQSGSRQAVTKMQEGVQRVEESVKLADDASRSLAKIVDSASRSYEMATTISRALDDQAQASSHLHGVTTRMSDHITEINRATREQAAGTQLLAREAELVREIAGQVKTATEEQSQAGRGITTALEKIAEDARAMRDQLDRQLHETDRIADASRTMLEIAQKNDAIAREFNATVQDLVSSGQEFESEVAKFRMAT